MRLLDRPDGVGLGEPAGPGRRPRRSASRWVVRTVKAGLALTLLVGLYLAFTLVQVWQASTGDSHPESGAIIVLGAAQYDGRPSPALEARLVHALELWEDGVAPVVVVTGGRQDGDRFTEATSGYNWLRQRGVPDEALRKEVNGTSTWESLQATARFLKKEGIEEVVLVSAPSHAYRVKGIAEEVGFTAHVSPADTDASVRALVRETVAVAAGRIIGYGRLGRLDRIG